MFDGGGVIFDAVDNSSFDALSENQVKITIADNAIITSIQFGAVWVGLIGDTGVLFVDVSLLAFETFCFETRIE